MTGLGAEAAEEELNDGPEPQDVMMIEVMIRLQRIHNF
jgi:hypothetical protein